MAKKILSFKKDSDDILLWVDAATPVREREKVVNTVYEVLSMYQVDCIVRKKNISVFIIEGLGRFSFYQDVCDDIFDAYTEWYMHRIVTI